MFFFWILDSRLWTGPRNFEWCWWCRIFQDLSVPGCLGEKPREWIRTNAMFYSHSRTCQIRKIWQIKEFFAKITIQLGKEPKKSKITIVLSWFDKWRITKAKRIIGCRKWIGHGYLQGWYFSSQKAKCGQVWRGFSTFIEFDMKCVSRKWIENTTNLFESNLLNLFQICSTK